MAKLKADFAPFKQQPFSEDAQPSTLAEQPRFGALPPEQRPGLIVSARSLKTVEDLHEFHMAAKYRNALHLFYGGKLPNNRFMMRFHKNPFGDGVVGIPQMRNLLDHLGDWRFETRSEHDELGYISVDIVGMIYLKSFFP